MRSSSICCSAVSAVLLFLALASGAQAAQQPLTAQLKDQAIATYAGQDASASTILLTASAAMGAVVGDRRDIGRSAEAVTAMRQAFVSFAWRLQGMPKFGLHLQTAARRLLVYEGSDATARFALECRVPKERRHDITAYRTATITVSHLTGAAYRVDTLDCQGRPRTKVVTDLAAG